MLTRQGSLRIWRRLLKTGGYGEREGKISLGTLIFLLIVVATVYVGIKMASPLIRYYQVRNLFGIEATRANRITDQEILSDITRKLKEIKAPVDLNEVLIRREGNTIQISVTYEESVSFIGGRYEKTFTFSPQSSVSF